MQVQVIEDPYIEVEDSNYSRKTSKYSCKNIVSFGMLFQKWTLNLKKMACSMNILVTDIVVLLLTSVYTK